MSDVNKELDGLTVIRNGSTLCIYGAVSVDVVNKLTALGYKVILKDGLS